MLGKKGVHKSHQSIGGGSANGEGNRRRRRSLWSRRRGEGVGHVYRKTRLRELRGGRRNGSARRGCERERENTFFLW